MRRKLLPPGTFFGNTSLFSSSDAAILEFNGAGGFHHFWPLCIQMIPMNDRKFLITTDATEETWKNMMNDVMSNDQKTAANKLKWKPSKNGGRTIATPSNTSSALAAGKRRGNKTHSTMDKVADIIVKGELGKEDASVLKRILDHACNATGLDIKEAVDPNQPNAGEYVHVASRDAGAPAGRLRVLLKSVDEVRKVFVALHGQAIKVNEDSIGIEVVNDVMTLEIASGNDPRTRR